MKKILSYHRKLQPIATKLTRCVQAQSTPADQPAVKSWRKMPKLPGLAIFRTLGFVFNEEVKNGQLHVLYVSNTTFKKNGEAS
jgi:hypothetical protein